MQTFHLNKTQKTSRFLLGITFCLSIFGLPIGIWLLTIAFRKIKLNKDYIQVSPLGRLIFFKDIKRIGIGSLKQLIPGNTSLNAASHPQKIANLIMLIELKSGKRLRLPYTNYEEGLSQAILKASKMKALPLKNSQLLPWKIDFK